MEEETREDKGKKRAKTDSGDEAEDMDIDDFDLEGIEKACVDKGKVYAPQEQVIILKEAILKDRLSNQLGISSRSHKEIEWKYEELSKKKGRNTNKRRLQK